MTASARATAWHSAPASESGVVSEAREPSYAEPASPRTPDAVIGGGGARWEWRGVLGCGGMGRVALMRDHDLGRDVALKEPVSHTDHPRLHREALITAALEHPGIVPIYDLGTSADGQPWFAMRVVRGRSLAAILAARPTPGERMALLRRLVGVAEAVAFAHDRGVVHRDLKPANIMLGSFGEAQVIDWGLAQAPPEIVGTGLDGTPTGVVGTPRAMSPEQARGERVGPASDVWSLGAIIWELFAGHAPFAGPREAVLAAVRAGRAPSLKEHAPDAPAEVVAIVTRAMAPSPRDRYRDAKELADDLGRYLDGRRVAAYSYSLGRVIRRVIRAWRAQLIVALVALVVLCTVLASSVSRIAEEQARASTSLAIALASAADQALTVDARAEAEVLAAHAFEHGARAEARGVLAALSSSRPVRTELGAYPCLPADVAGARVLCHSAEEVALYDGSELVWRRRVDASRAAFLLGEQAVLSVGRTQHQRLDARTGEPLAAPMPSANRLFTAAPDGRSVIGLTSADLQRVRHDGVATIEGLCPGDHAAAAALHADGERYAVLCRDGILQLGSFAGHAGARPPELVQTTLVWPRFELTALQFIPGSDDLIGGTLQGLVLRLSPGGPGHEVVWQSRGSVRAILVAPDGRRALITFDALSPMVLDLAARASLGRLPAGEPGLVRWLADGALEALGRVHTRWDFRAVRPRALELGEGITALAASSDGTRLAIAHGSAVTLVDMAARSPAGTVRWQDGFVKDLGFVPDSHDVIAHGFGDQHLTRLDARLVPAGSIGESRWRRLALLSDGAVLAARYTPGLELHRTGEAMRSLGALDVQDLVASHDGVHVAVLADGLVLAGSDLGRGGQLLACAREPSAVAIAPAGAGRVAVALPDAVIVRCGDHPSAVRHVARAGAQLLSLAAAAGLLAAGGRDGSVWLWRMGDGEPLAIFRDHEARVGALAFEPAGRWLAAGDWAGRIAFFDVPLRDDGHDERPAIAEREWGLELDRAFGARVAPDPLVIWRDAIP